MGLLLHLPPGRPPPQASHGKSLCVGKHQLVTFSRHSPHFFPFLVPHHTWLNAQQGQRLLGLQEGVRSRATRAPGAAHFPTLSRELALRWQEAPHPISGLAAPLLVSHQVMEEEITGDALEGAEVFTGGGEQTGAQLVFYLLGQNEFPSPHKFPLSAHPPKTVLSPPFSNILLYCPDLHGLLPRLEICKSKSEGPGMQTQWVALRLCKGHDPGRWEEFSTAGSSTESTVQCVALRKRGTVHSNWGRIRLSLDPGNPGLETTNPMWRVKGTWNLPLA